MNLDAPLSEERVLVVGVPGPEVAAAAGPRPLVIAGATTSARADLDALPFLDGAFDRVLFAADVASLGKEGAERTLREVFRVVRPGGLAVLEMRGDGERSLAVRLGRLGLDFEIERRNGAIVATARRETSVAPEVWRSLASGAEAARWNDSMFRFKQTPYDPWTVAGRIFLRRVRWIAKRVPREHGLRVLEIGCEAGGLLRHLPAEPVVVGLDVSGAALRVAHDALGERCAGFVQADATSPLPFRDGTFDIVISSEMLEHCRSPHRAVANMHRLLKPGGTALVSVPNERHYLRWKAWLRKAPLFRLALRGIEEDAAAWHLHHDFDRGKLRSLLDGFFAIERETTILGTTLLYDLRKL